MTLLEPVAISSSEDRERRARFTHGATFTLEELSSERAPEHLASLRASEPVTWMPELGGWLVSSRELAREVLLPREDVSVESEQNMVRASLGRMMLTVDEPTHERMRGPFDAHFRPRAVRESFEGVCARVARDLLSAWSPGEVELSVAFARPYAILMAAEVLGIELGDVDAMIETYDAFAAAMEYTGDPEPLERARNAREALDVLLAKSLELLLRLVLQLLLAFGVFSILLPTLWTPLTFTMLMGAFAIALVSLAVGTSVSLRRPTRARQRGMAMRGNTGWAGFAYSFGIFAAAGAVGGLIWGARWLTAREFAVHARGQAAADVVGLALSVLMLAAAFAIWWRSLDLNARTLVESREKLIEALARSSDD